MIMMVRDSGQGSRRVIPDDSSEGQNLGLDMRYERTPDQHWQDKVNIQNMRSLLKTYPVQNEVLTEQLYKYR